MLHGIRLPRQLFALLRVVLVRQELLLDVVDVKARHTVQIHEMRKRIATCHARRDHISGQSEKFGIAESQRPVDEVKQQTRRERLWTMGMGCRHRQSQHDVGGRVMRFVGNGSKLGDVPSVDLGDDEPFGRTRHYYRTVEGHFHLLAVLINDHNAVALLEGLDPLSIESYALFDGLLARRKIGVPDNNVGQLRGISGKVKGCSNDTGSCFSHGL